MRDQWPASKALRAAATAASTSADLHEATVVRTLPVAGLTQSNLSPSMASTKRPPMNAWLRKLSPAARAFQSSSVKSNIAVISLCMRSPVIGASAPVGSG